VAGQLRRRDGVSTGEGMTGPDEQLVRIICVDIGVQRHDIKLDAGMYTVEMLDQDSGRNPPAEDVDPQGSSGQSAPCVRSG
jgi:hypothetical protein